MAKPTRCILCGKVTEELNHWGQCDCVYATIRPPVEWDAMSFEEAERHHEREQEGPRYGDEGPSEAELALELEHDIAGLRAGAEHAPWVTREEAIADLEKQLSNYRERQ